MIILQPHKWSVLAPQTRLDWLGESTRQSIEQKWRVTAHVNDGHVVWRGEFWDREDFDSFLLHLAQYELVGTPMPKEVAKLSVPYWEPLPYPVFYRIDSAIAITRTSPSNQEFRMPMDWQLILFDTNVSVPSDGSTSSSNRTYTAAADMSAINTVQCIGGGAGGVTGSDYATSESGGGGAGGAWAKALNLAGISPGASVTYRLEAAAASDAAGKDVWFNASAFPSGSVEACGAKGGGVGTMLTGGTGGAAASCYGGTGTDTKQVNPGSTYAKSGGNGGSAANYPGPGGGGAGGPNGAGGAGGATNNGTGGGGGGGNGGGAAGATGSTNGGNGGAGRSITNTSTSGGAGATTSGGNGTAASAGTGGGGGAGRYVGGAGAAGGTGADIDDGATKYGSGGGGGGTSYSSSAVPASGAGGNYGGGGGGGTMASSPGGAGAKGLIYLTYTPGSSSATYRFFNMF